MLFDVNIGVVVTVVVVAAPDAVEVAGGVVVVVAHARQGNIAHFQFQSNSGKDLHQMQDRRLASRYQRRRSFCFARSSEKPSYYY